jgi:surface antigen
MMIDGIPVMTRILAGATAIAFACTLVAPAVAQPPPWAPAHGYRAKHKPKIPPVKPVVQLPAVGIPDGTCHRETLGAILGGAAGGYLGSQIGGGSGQLAATAAGAVIGLIVGGSIGRSMDRLDHACTGQVLEQAQTGQSVQWVEPGSNVQYRVTPTRTFEQAGRYCREYTTTATIGGEARSVYGTACRQPDGTWKLES